MASTDAQIPGYVRFAIAGLAGGASSLASHPFDLVKYRMQMRGKGGTEKGFRTMSYSMYHIVTHEGPLTLFDGLSASVLRQLTLTTTRLGLYSVIVDKFIAADGTQPSIFLQLSAGLLSGALGAIVGNPADVALVRMSVDGSRPSLEQYKYKNIFDAIYKITANEGVKALWIGWKPATVRCMILNITQLVLYKNTKVQLLKSDSFADNTTLHVICSIWTAFVSSIATSPVDVAKTRIMSMSFKDGKPEYTGTFDVCLKMIKQEGFFSLWKGVTPNFFRILPNNFVVFIVLEMLTKAYKRFILEDDSGSGF